MAIQVNNARSMHSYPASNFSLGVKIK